MLRGRTYVLLSAYDELMVVGSRWTRIYARSAALHAKSGVSSTIGAAIGSQPTASAQPPEQHALPYITVIPTLHVASLKFYDRVLEYMQQAVNKNPNVVILLEGVCDSVKAAVHQMEEYRLIAQSAKLRETLLSKADANTIYPPDVIREICSELKVSYPLLKQLEDTVRLQDCYLKPKMAALCGSHLRNDADLVMEEVRQILEEETVRLAALGQAPLPSSVSVSELGAFPVVRKCRERKVARQARALCERWLTQSVEGEVIIPWGYFHTEAIIHYIYEKNAESATVTGAAAAVTEGTNTSDKESNTTAHVVFVESDEVLAKVPFGIPREMIESVASDTSGGSDAPAQPPSS